MANMTEYVEFHARSAFSFLEGASTPEALAQAAAERALPAIAVLDRNGVYGAPRTHFAMRQAGGRAHVGAEVRVGDDEASATYLPLIARTRTGYQNLCRMITAAKLRVAKNTPCRTSWAELEHYGEGLVCLTGDACGPLAAALAQGVDAASDAVARLQQALGAENVYVELQRHCERAQEARNHAAIGIARRLGLPLLATNGACYARREDRELLDALTCIKHQRSFHDAGRLLAKNDFRHLRSGEEMAALFRDLPQAIANTAELSASIEFTLQDLGYQFPLYPVPPGETMDTFLRQITMCGARERYGSIDANIAVQLERELKLIEKLGLAGYFLIVWDIVRYCREHAIMAQGRGSAANSAVCYVLNITAVDPIRMDLLFERFLSEERAEWPDIDIDLPSGDEREQVIQYVYRRYGERGAAMTANVISYRGRMAAREIGKVLGFKAEEQARLSAAMGTWEWHDPEETAERQFQHAGFDLRDPLIRRYFDLTQRVRDLPRHLGQHSGGMVVCQGQLDSVVPLEPASMPGRVVVQWDKDDCADLGIIKIDLLGLGMLAVIKECIAIIGDKYGEKIEPAKLPPDEELHDVYQTIREADTIGMFQIESRAQMASLPRNDPERFYDLVTQVALIRPGPIVGQATNPYLNRRQGKEPVTYLHPLLEPILDRTLGVPLFQEQLLRIAMTCANFTGSEAEELRRALGSRRSHEKMRRLEQRFRAGLTANEIPREIHDEIWRYIGSFAMYGFPESHSASFALIALLSAYLKVRYLPAFTAAILNNQPMGFYSPAVLVKDAQRHGARILPIDVQRSEWQCALEPLADCGHFAVRLGLRYVRHLRQQTALQLIEQRRVGGFASIDDLVLRVPALSKSDLETLAATGALNRIAGTAHRRDALWQVARAVVTAGPLLEQLSEESQATPLRKMEHDERMHADFHGTGLTIDAHPLSRMRKQLAQAGVCRACDLKQIANGRRVLYAGSVITRQRPGTAKGFIFISLEDESGIANVIVTPDLYRKQRMIVLSEDYLWVEGVLQNVDGVIHVKATELKPLAMHRALPPVPIHKNFA